MKKKIIGICICMLLIAAAFSATGTMNKDIEQNVLSVTSSGVEWEKTYGGNEFDWLFDVQETDDGYIAAGVTENQNLHFAWMLKTNTTGHKTWSTVNNNWYGPTPGQEDIAVECVQQIDGGNGGYIAGGYGYAYNTIYGYWSSVGCLWKVNAAGETEWFKGIVNESEQWSYSPFAIEVVDDGFICAGWYGQTTTYPDFILDAALFKTDLNGTLLWGQRYDAGGFDWVRSLWPTNDGGYFLAGATQQPNPYTTNDAYYMVKTDGNGTKQWDKIFDGPGSDYSAVRGCRQTDDGGYIMCGQSDSWDDDHYDLWIVKTDASGNMEWNKTYGGPNDDHCYGMEATTNGYVFVVVKNAWVMTGNKEDLWLIETNKTGDVTWEFLVEKEGTQWLQVIRQTKDAGFIIAGRTGTLNNPSSDGILMKVAPFPKLDIDIKGGLGITVIANNSGKGDASNVPYVINVKGGFFKQINKTFEGDMTIMAGKEETVKTGLIFGFGPITVTAKVGWTEKTMKGIYFLIFSMVKK